MDAFAWVCWLSVLLVLGQSGTADLVASFAIFTCGAVVGCFAVLAADRRTARRRRKER